MTSLFSLIRPITAVLLLLPIFSLSCDTVVQTNCRQNASERKVIESSEDVNNLWNTRISLWNRREAGNQLVIVDKSLIVLDSFCQKVVSFEINSGKVIWEKSINSNSITLNPYNHDVVFLTQVSGTKRQIFALAVTDGEIIWENTEFNNRRTGISVQPVSATELLLYLGSPDVSDEVYVLDSNTGDLLQELTIPDQTLLLSQEVVWVQNGCSLQAQQRNTQNILWEWCNPPYSSNIRLKPTLMDDYLIIQNSGEVSRLFTLDRHTGVMLWALEDMATVSNVVLNENNLYVLTHLAQLLRINPSTGELLGNIRFETPQVTDLDHSLIGPRLIGGSWIAVSESFIAIYFQDTDLLSVYEITIN